MENGMSGKKPEITPEVYGKLVGFYREHPAEFTEAGKFIGRPAAFAKRAYLEGWPSLPWAAPIAHVLEEEHKNALAIATRQLGMEQASDEIRAELIKRYELNIAANNAKAAAHASSSVASMMEGIEMLGESIGRAFKLVSKSLGDEDEIPEFVDDPVFEGMKSWRSADDKRVEFIKNKVSLIKDVTKILEQSSNVMDKTFKNSKPISAPTQGHEKLPDMTDEERVHALRLAEKVNRRAEARSIIEVTHVKS